MVVKNRDLKKAQEITYQHIENQRGDHPIYQRGKPGSLICCILD